jgi:hypothetical protein
MLWKASLGSEVLPSSSTSQLLSSSAVSFTDELKYEVRNSSPHYIYHIHIDYKLTIRA